METCLIDTFFLHLYYLSCRADSDSTGFDVSVIATLRMTRHYSGKFMQMQNFHAMKFSVNAAAITLYN